MVPGESQTVLVVDDDRALADVYASHLEFRYDVEAAYDGETALEKVTDDVDVVLLDRRMHGLSGHDVLERIRDCGLICGVVIVSAVDPGFDILDMGFDDYLIKPVKPAELEAVVADTVERLDERDDVREYLALASKVATLRLEKNPGELEDNEEYAELVRELEAFEERIPADEVDVPAGYRTSS